MIRFWRRQIRHKKENNAQKAKGPLGIAISFHYFNAQFI